MTQTLQKCRIRLVPPHHLYHAGPLIRRDTAILTEFLDAGLDLLDPFKEPDTDVAREYTHGRTIS